MSSSSPIRRHPSIVTIAHGRAIQSTTTTETTTETTTTTTGHRTGGRPRPVYSIDYDTVAHPATPHIAHATHRTSHMARMGPQYVAYGHGLIKWWGVVSGCGRSDTHTHAHTPARRRRRRDRTRLHRLRRWGIPRPTRPRGRRYSSEDSIAPSMKVREAYVSRVYVCIHIYIYIYMYAWCRAPRGGARARSMMIAR